VELRLAERPALPSVPLWLVAARSVRGLPRVDALWRFLEARLPPLLSAGNAPRPGRSRSAP